MPAPTTIILDTTEEVKALTQMFHRCDIDTLEADIDQHLLDLFGCLWNTETGLKTAEEYTQDCFEVFMSTEIPGELAVQYAHAMTAFAEKMMSKLKQNHLYNDHGEIDYVFERRLGSDVVLVALEDHLWRPRKD